MKWEIKKFIGSRLLAMIVPLAVLVNAFLFNAYLDGSGIQYAQQLYEIKETVPERAEQLRLAVYSNQEYEHELVTGNIYDELDLYEDVLQRIASVEGYSEFLNGVLAETRARIGSGLFGSEGSFELNSLYATELMYEGLEYIEPEVCFSYPFELLSSYNLCDAIAVLIGISMILILFCQESETGTIRLIKSTRNGRSNLFVRKYFAVLLVSAAVYAAMCLCDFIIISLSYGFIDFSLPVQSLYGYLACPYNLSVNAFALSLITTKILGIFAVMSLFMFFGCIFKKPGTIIAAISALAFAYVTSTIPNNIPRYLNILSSWNAHTLYEGLIYLNFFGLPISRLAAVTAFSLFIILSSFSASLVLFVRKSVGNRRHPSAGKHKRLFGHSLSTRHYETRKLLLSCGGIAAVLTLICVQVLTYIGYPAEIRSPYEDVYRRYSVLLEGEPDTSKDEYLNSEAGRFKDLRTEYSALMNAAGSAPGLSSYADGIRSQLDAEPAFLEAKKQYQQLEEGKYYIYKTPYELLYNSDGLKRDLGDTAKLLLALSMSLPFFFCMEYESGVSLLINSIGAHETVKKAKKKTALSFALICALAAFAPRTAIIWVLYGLPQIGRPANDLQLFAYLPDCIAIWGVFLIALAARVLIAFSSVYLIFKIVKRTKNSVTAVTLSLLLLPGVAALIWIVS